MSTNDSYKFYCLKLKHKRYRDETKRLIALYLQLSVFFYLNPYQMKQKVIIIVDFVEAIA